MPLWLPRVGLASLNENVAEIVQCTGYFTSRAAAKGFMRQATSYLQAARQLEVRPLHLNLTPGRQNLTRLWRWT